MLSISFMLLQDLCDERICHVYCLKIAVHAVHVEIKDIYRCRRLSLAEQSLNWMFLLLFFVQNCSVSLASDWHIFLLLLILRYSLSITNEKEIEMKTKRKCFQQIVQFDFPVYFTVCSRKLHFVKPIILLIFDTFNILTH